MMDRPIRSFCVPRLLVRDARLARQEAVDRAGRCEAERVGLTYPPPPQKRKAGKPSVQAKWEEALLCHIREHTLLPAGVDRTVRVGWRPGCPLVLPDGAVSLPPRHDSEEIVEEPANKKAKRAKVNVPLQGIAYYFDYVDSMKALCGWSAQRSFRSLQECAPEIYGSVHHCTPIRWKRPHSKEVDEDGLAPRGRRRKVPAAAMLRFMELAQRATAQLAVPSATLKSLFERQLEDMGTPQTLCSLGPTFSQRVEVHVHVEQPKWIGEDDRRCHFQRTEQRQAQGALPPPLAIRHPDPLDTCLELGPDICTVVTNSQERVVTRGSSAEPCRG